jgi:hypothetical protein
MSPLFDELHMHMCDAVHGDDVSSEEFGARVTASVLKYVDAHKAAGVRAYVTRDAGYVQASISGIDDLVDPGLPPVTYKLQLTGHF